MRSVNTVQYWIRDHTGHFKTGVLKLYGPANNTEEQAEVLVAVRAYRGKASAVFGNDMKRGG